MVPTIKTFADFLAAKGLKLTGERQMIVREVFSNHRHFEIEQLLTDLRGKSRKASRATVYRTLDLLVEAGLVRKVCQGAGHFTYEPMLEGQKHDHLICINCAKVISFQDPEIERLKKRICHELGFELAGYCFQLFGHCKSCRS